ncbi:phage-related minor tail protein [Scopulibacillus darangshiensis]|uniref:Phage-related minor tail protein n=1 Tax=Scopulibacillus darangshiensis TaxID=442528 RepID=A0A4R2PCN6_9BACL|nr:phage tail tape measure protein [Scopulibacillus darangshiensis]TCP32188.1 phage-related minor tail protein [Scopulibacillus darangshiensis]
MANNEEIGNLIVKVGIEGAGFDKGIKNINSQMKLAKSELKAASGGMKSFGKSTDEMNTKAASLERQLQLQGEKAKQLREQYDKLVQTQGKNADATLRVGTKLNNTIGSYNRLKSQLDDVNGQIRANNEQIKKNSNRWNIATERIGAFQEKMSVAGTRFKDVGRNMTQSITLPIAGVGLGALKAASDFQRSQGTIQAQLGVTGSEAKKLNGIVSRVWKQGFGDTTEQVRNTLTTVKRNIQDINDQDLKKVTTGALGLNEAFEADVNESTRTASVLMKNFKLSGTDAFDLMTVGFQKGGDFSGELLDTLREYSPQFASMGFSAKGMLNILIQGAQNGAFNLDKVGDAVKELGVRVVDGSKTTNEGFKAIGLNTKKMSEAFGKGGESAQRAFAATIAGLANMKDHVKQQQAGVALFGTQWEDVKEKVILSMDASKDSIGKVTGATDKLNKSLKNNDAAKLQQEWRKFQKALVPVGTQLLKIGSKFLPVLSDSVETFNSFLEKLTPKQKEWVIGLGAAVAVIGPLTFTLGSMLRVVSGLSGGLAFITTKFGKFNRSAKAAGIVASGFGGGAAKAEKGVSALGKTTKKAGLLSKIFGGAIGKSGGKVAGLGGKVLGAVSKFGKFGKILGVARFGLSALGGPIGLLASVGIPLLIKGGVKLYKHFKEKAIPSVNQFGKEVSASTQKSVKSYLKLNDKATQQLMALEISGKRISKNTAASLTKTFDQMGKKIISADQKNFERDSNVLKGFMNSNKSFSSKNQQDILNNIKKSHKINQQETKNDQKKIADILKQGSSQQKKVSQKAEDDINAIKKKASKEHRDLYQSEKDKIAKIKNDEKKQITKITKQTRDDVNFWQSDMKMRAVKTLSKSYQEQRAIYTQLSSQASILSARQAATVVKNSKKTKDKTIADAEKKRQKVIKAADYEYYETGSISKEQHDKIVKAANDTYNKTKKNAENMHKKVVSEAKKQAKGHIDQVNWETGDILSKWDQFTNKISGWLDWLKDLFGIKRSKRKKPNPKPRAHGSLNSADHYAKGTDFHPGGPAIVGEKGREMAHIPGFGMTMVGTQGQQLLNLPRGSSVLPNKDTEKIMSGKLFGYAGGVGKWFDWLIKGPATLLKNSLSKFGIGFNLPGEFSSLAKGAITKVKDWGLDWIKDKISGFMSFGGNVSGSVKSWIAKAMAITGTPSSWFKPLITIAMKESGGNPNAINLWDSNARAGHPSQGLFQTIPSTFNAYKIPGLGGITNPIASGVAAIRYIIDRYGSIWNHPGIHNMARGGGYLGYENGGIVNRKQLAWVAENGPEAIIPLSLNKRERATRLLEDTNRRLGVNDQHSYAPEYVLVDLHLDKDRIARVMAKPITVEQERHKNHNRRSFKGRLA